MTARRESDPPTALAIALIWSFLVIVGIVLAVTL